MDVVSVPLEKTNESADADKSKMQNAKCRLGTRMFANHGCVTVVQSCQKNLTQLKLTDRLLFYPFVQTVAAHSLSTLPYQLLAYKQHHLISYLSTYNTTCHALLYICITKRHYQEITETTATGIVISSNTMQTSR